MKATYKYTREDVDELSFEVGEIIQVVEYEDPDEQVFKKKIQQVGMDSNLKMFLLFQEEGWLMGVKETTGEKGMFPANFTRPL